MEGQPTSAMQAGQLAGEVKAIKTSAFEKIVGDTQRTNDRIGSAIHQLEAFFARAQGPTPEPEGAAKGLDAPPGLIGQLGHELDHQNNLLDRLTHLTAKLNEVA